MIPHKTLKLNLTESQIHKLTQLNEILSQKLEQIGTLRPEMLADLTIEIKRILEAQTEFQNIAAKIQNKQTRLHLTHDNPNILNLPWRLATQNLENLYLTKGKNIERDLPILKADNPPLKILVMISSPENSDYDSILDYEKEEDQIIQAFEPLFDIGQVEIDFTDDGSLENLAEKLAANRYHIVHFSGHGIYRDNTGYLALEDSLTMNQQMVKAEDFAQVFQLSLKNMPALIVLSSCQTAKGGTELGMQSVAGELLLKGLPAVIAMSVSVTDYFATYFASALYQFLAKKEPLFRAFQKAIGETHRHEQERNQNHLPSQWMIPQLFVSQQIMQPVDFGKDEQKLNFEAWKYIEGKEEKTTVQTDRPKNYRFIGRRLNRREIFKKLKENPAILLKGQGGVGKTSMADYILKRLVVNEARVQPFIFNETDLSLTSVLKAIKDFLKKTPSSTFIGCAKNIHNNHAFKQFYYLFPHLKKECTPLFIFDNFESFQSGKGEKLKHEHGDLKAIIDYLLKEKIGLVITGRYSIPEFPDLPSKDLNYVHVNDFLKKALQLFLKQLPQKIQLTGLDLLEDNKDRLTFREVVTWLHETFGGNYRALEFFNKLFLKKVIETKDKAKLLETLHSISNFKKEHAQTAVETKQEMSKDILFEELLLLLSDDEKTTLRLLCHFRIPVLVTALQMQRHDLDYPKLFDELLELTLLERHIDLEHEALVYYYITPLVKGLVKETLGKEGMIEFSNEHAGNYHLWIQNEINIQKIVDLEEAFEFFKSSKNGEKLNIVGNTLCNFYYGISQYYYALRIGLEVHLVNVENTTWDILNIISMVFHIFGEEEKAIKFLELCLKKAKQEKNLDKQESSLNNLGEDYSKRSNYKKALDHFEQALKIQQEIGNKLSEGVTLNNIGQVYDAQGEYEDALDYYGRALVICKSLRNNRMEGLILNNISQIHQTLGDINKASDYLFKSLRFHKMANNKYGEGMTLNNLGTNANAIGDFKKALVFFEESLKIRREIGDKLGEGTNLNNIGQIYIYHQKNYVLASKYLNLALKINHEIGNKRGEVSSLHNIAMLAKEEKDYVKFFDFASRSYHLAVSINDKYAIFISSLVLGKYICSTGRIRQGLPFIRQAFQISMSLKLPNTEKIASIIDHYQNLKQ
jgi:tetratricopeptide (TPR) repeat protein